MDSPARTTEVEVPSVPELQVRDEVHRGKLRLRERSVRYLAGLGSGVQFGVHADNLKNLVRGIVERVLYVRRGEGLSKPPQPKVGVFGRLSSIRRRLLRKTPSTPVVARDDYPLLYSGRKRAVYQNAVDSLKVRGLTVKDAIVSTFIKAEKVNFSAKGDPAPRVIQPRSPRYNVEVGRYLKLFEKALCEGFRRAFGYCVILKGMNADQVGNTLAAHWQVFSHPVAVGLDASRFDQHVSRQALEWEHSVYNAVFRSPELRRLLRWQLDNRGVGRTEGKRVDYRVSGCRMSGDINTGMGNCLIMSSIVIAYCESVGIVYRLANNGDDCVVFLDKADLPRLAGLDQWFLDFGFTLTREAPCYRLEEVEFCQFHPVRVATGWRMVRDPRIAMSKDCVSLVSWATEKDFRYWASAVGACGSALTAGVPVWAAWYGILQRVGGGGTAGVSERVNECGAYYWSRGVTPCSITDESRASFYYAFGITPDEQVALEEYYTYIQDTAAHTPVTCLSPSIHSDFENPLTCLNEARRS